MRHRTIALTTAVTTALIVATLALAAGTASAEARPPTSPGMQRMQELMADDGSPGMQRMHHRMMTGPGVHAPHSH